ATATTHAREWQEVEDLLAGLLWGSRPARGEAWARREAAVLLALLDGLATAALVEPVRMPGQRAEGILNDQLDRVLGADPDASTR
ncbi:MAG: TetR family transcriptional regulator C-terminal domain-containing protein, partial [Propionibacteriaceae bacterium]